MNDANNIQEILDKLSHLPIQSQLEKIESLLSETKDDVESQKILKNKRLELSLVLQQQKGFPVRVVEIIETLQVIDVDSEEAQILANEMVKIGNVGGIILAIIKIINLNSKSGKILVDVILTRGNISSIITAEQRIVNELVLIWVDGIIKELEVIDNPNYKIHLGSQYLNAKQLASEIKNLTPIGKRFIRSWIKRDK